MIRRVTRWVSKEKLAHLTHGDLRQSVALVTKGSDAGSNSADITIEYDDGEPEMPKTRERVVEGYSAKSGTSYVFAESYGNACFTFKEYLPARLIITEPVPPKSPEERIGEALADHDRHHENHGTCPTPGVWACTMARILRGEGD